MPLASIPVTQACRCLVAAGSPSPALAVGSTAASLMRWIIRNFIGVAGLRPQAQKAPRKRMRAAAGAAVAYAVTRARTLAPGSYRPCANGVPLGLAAVRQHGPALRSAAARRVLEPSADA